MFDNKNPVQIFLFFILLFPLINFNDHKLKQFNFCNLNAFNNNSSKTCMSYISVINIKYLITLFPRTKIVVRKIF